MYGRYCDVRVASAPEKCPWAKPRRHDIRLSGWECLPTPLARASVLLDAE